MKQNSQRVADDRLGCYFVALGRDPIPEWLITALGVVQWTRTQQWGLEASKAETTLIRDSCEEAHAHLLENPPDVSRARAAIAFLQLRL